ncbi:Interferon-induced very large GTPase 1 [Liparis tanakae]|uniref:Interferon-induced very large GTPase 1 n=1 Tax=Liparis tanakae TaxID=230148 RepID=A0A4Z2H0V5_9TELE|nr:Interferon-induced very large GTPase 1 [Liparis tanakae]
MLVQWRGRFESKIKEFHDDQVGGVKRKLDGVIVQKRACRKLDAKKTEFENKLLQESRELAHQLKDQNKDEKELEEQFNCVWRDLVEELIADTKPIEDIDYEEDQSTVLRELGFEYSLIDESKRSARYKEIAMAEQEGLRSFVYDVEQQALDSIKGKPVATEGYSATHLQEVANNVKGRVTQFESQKKYALKKEFTVDLLLYVFHRAWSWLSESHKEFKVKNDAHSYVESKKEHYCSIFKKYCKGSSSAVVLGELICDKLRSSTVKAVCNRTSNDLAGVMKNNFPAFNGNRSKFEKHMLKSLADKEDFIDFITYIHNPKYQAKSYIREAVQEYIFKDKKEKALETFKKNVEEVKKEVSGALLTATEKEKKRGKEGGLNMWAKEFVSLLEDELTFNTDCCQSFSDIKDFDFLKQEIEKGHASIIEELNSLSLDEIKKFQLKPEQMFIDQLDSYCWEKCPFCSAVCTNTVTNHDEDHSVPFHRSLAFLLQERPSFLLNAPLPTEGLGEVAPGRSFPGVSILKLSVKAREAGQSDKPRLQTCKQKEEEEITLNSTSLSLGKFPKNWVTHLETEEGLSRPGSARCCLMSSDWLADRMNAVFMLSIQAATHAHRDDRHPLGESTFSWGREMAFLMMGETSGGGDDNSRELPRGRGTEFFRTCRKLRVKNLVVLELFAESGLSGSLMPP